MEVEVPPPRHASWRRYTNKVIALEISTVTRHYDEAVQYGKLPADDGLMFDLIECPKKQREEATVSFPDFSSQRDRRTAVLLNGTLNHSTDIQGVLSALRPRLSSTSRVIAVLYNPYFGWVYRLATRMGIRSGPAPSTFVTKSDLLNIARLSGFRVVRTRLAVYSPFRLGGLGGVINAIMPVVPLLRHLSLTMVAVLAPTTPVAAPRMISIVIPARNERGNIGPALEALKELRHSLPPLDVIFVEGHSTDGTWDEIQRLSPEYQQFFSVRSFRQTGKGKSDAVRLGFGEATGDILTILDADLTMPPELLTRFWTAYRDGYGEFINGSRLVYEAEQAAMRYLNRLGNVMFAKMLSRVLSVRIGDSLCGTKLLARHDYNRFTAWRAEFGDFDPFGDFELLFPAAVLGLAIVDVPIRYRARSYGETNISRFRHGIMLLKMTVFGFCKVRLGRVS